MRPYRSVAGPLILIAIGLLFLLHTITPALHVFELFARYWPFLLILWGVVQLMEIGIWAARGARAPYRSAGGGGWLLVILICIVGYAAWQSQNAEWWRHLNFGNGIDFLGQDHDYSIPPQQHASGPAPHIVIENFRGDAKITAVDGNSITVSGHKLVRAMDVHSADEVDRNTPVEILTQGKVIVIRCNQDRADHRQLVTTDLDLNVPRASSIEATGSRGDFDISGIAGDVDLSSENAGVHIENVDGSLRIDTRRSNEIRCANVRGAVTLRGRGDDVSLSKVSGDVNVEGTYVGTVELEDIANPVRVDSGRSQFDARRITGQLTLARGSIDGHGVSGPTKVAVHATDITLSDFSDALDISCDRGDVELHPGLPIGPMQVRISSGNIDLSLPKSVKVALAAATRHGSVESDLGPVFHEQSEGAGARIQGGAGGPDLTLTTNRGNITLHTEPHHSPANSSSANSANEVAQAVQ